MITDQKEVYWDKEIHRPEYVKTREHMLESSPHAFVCNTNMYTCTKHLLGERERFKWMGERIKIKVSNICFGACILVQKNKSDDLDMKLRIKMANFLYKFNDAKQCMQKKVSSGSHDQKYWSKLSVTVFALKLG